MSLTGERREWERETEPRLWPRQSESVGEVDSGQAGPGGRVVTKEDALGWPERRKNPCHSRGEGTTLFGEKRPKRMPQLAGKIGIVVGVANQRSIAWAIARAWATEGATLAFTYQGERLKESVEELAAGIQPGALVVACDVTDDEQIARAFDAVQQRHGRLDLLLHSIAFAPREALQGAFIDTGREAFRVALDVSTYSLAALARGAAPLMTRGGSILSLSYYGAEKVVPHYNVMGVAKAALEAATRYLAYDLGPKGVRVNCISAGPVNTVAARAIAGFTDILRHYESKAPLKRNVTLEELGGTAVFLASDAAAAITGQVLYVDCGYQIMGI